MYSQVFCAFLMSEYFLGSLHTGLFLFLVERFYETSNIRFFPPSVANKERVFAQFTCSAAAHSLLQ